MKQLFIFLIGIVFISCNPNQKESTTSNGASSEATVHSENFDWLLGKWKRLNEEEGKETFENWEKTNGNEYSGIGFTMQNGDTIKQEKMQLTKADGSWELHVKVPEETNPTLFNMTDFNEDEFVCANHEIDFPNKIRYWKNGNNINASVSNSEFEIAFEFERFSSASMKN